MGTRNYQRGSPVISPEQVQEIAELIAAQALNEDVILPLLRKQYETMHFSYCMDDDIGRRKAVLETENFNLYLIDGREHCLCLTNDYSIATGIVVAEIIPE
jgi:hypothetical protein